MDDSAKADEWVRFVNALTMQDSKLQALAHLPKEMRLAVLKRMKVLTAEDVFNATTVE